RRLVSKRTIEKLIADFQNAGYINDSEWIASFVRRYWASGTGPQAIVMKLRAKGIPQEAAESAISLVCTDDAQKGKIQRLLGTKYRNKNLSDFKEKQKVIASLIRKGFDYEEITQVLQSQPAYNS